MRWQLTTEDKTLLETQLSVNVSRETIEKIFSLIELTGEWNHQLNLTGAKTPHDFILHHFLDCYSAVFAIKGEVAFIDVGTGAGLPSLYWALLRSDFILLGVDVSQKKVAFLQRAKSLLDIKNFFALRKDFKMLSPSDLANQLPENFSCVSRGTAPPRDLLELAKNSLLKWRAWYVFSTPNLHHDFLTLKKEYGMEVEKISYTFGPGTQKELRSGLLTVIRQSK